MKAAAEHGHMESLIEALRDPACYPHAADRVELEETHISWVLLAGDYAYKLKKPVRLPFLDFSTLAARRHFCEEELRLNRRTAPELYLEVVPIVRDAGGAVRINPGAAARAGAPAEPLEYAVKMRRFAAGELADAMARRGALGEAEIDALAAEIARFHLAAPRADDSSAWGTPEGVEAPALANFEQIGAPLDALRDWTRREGRRSRRAARRATCANATATCTWATSRSSAAARCPSIASSSIRRCAGSTSWARWPSWSWTC